MPSDFQNFALNLALKRALSELELKNPTPVQAGAIPLLLQGLDVIAQSQTGSGKTLAFLLPLLHKIQSSDPRPQALVLCPTRELAVQVTREARKLSRHLPNLKVVNLVGGQPVSPQASSLEQGAHLVVGTPGRVLDHLRRGSLNLELLTFLVLDEADRMLDMGFQEEIEAILSLAPEARQTALFSATFPGAIDQISRAYLKNPEKISISRQESSEPVISHKLIRMEDSAQKFDFLLSCLLHEAPDSAIIFCNLKITVNEVFEKLEEAGVSAACLHGDLDQTDRDRVMAKFRNESVRVLIATDVAARGIDVAGLDLVINYDLPKPDIYVHRTGRTGRAGKTGIAYSLAEKKEEYKIRLIEEETGSRPLEVDLLAASVPIEPGCKLSKARMQTLYISGGRKDKVRPGDILGALTGEAGGLKAAQVGKIEIHDRFSYVAVDKSVAEAALQSLRDGKIKGRKFRVEPVI